jgi:hypothetical protein
MTTAFRPSHWCATLVFISTIMAAPLASGANASTAIQRQIDALLKHRLKPEALPIDPPNPFVMPTGTRDLPGEISAKTTLPTASDSGAAAETSPSPESALASNAEILVTCAGRLKIGGLMRLKDHTQIVINDVPRREGDSIAAQWNNTTVSLRVMRVQTGVLVLRLGEAEVLVKF